MRGVTCLWLGAVALYGLPYVPQDQTYFKGTSEMGRLKDYQNDDTDRGRFRKKYDGDGWVITEYSYRKREGELFEIAVRADKKGEDKICRNFAPDGSIMGSVKLRSRPLYGLEKLYGDGKYRNHEYIIIVEGEKCAEAAQKFFDEYIVITYSGGASSINYTDWKPLQGKVVLILADNDIPGLNSALSVSDKLKKFRCTVTIYSRHGDDKTDIADWIEDCETAEKRMDLR